jgi:hypothetical protein
MAEDQSSCPVGSGDSSRIGVYVDGGWWFHLTYYWLMNHPMKVRLALDGVADAIRWYARDVFDCPVNRIRIHRFHWVGGPQSTIAARFGATLDRLGVVRHHMWHNPTNGRMTGTKVELALTCYDEVYDHDLDMVALITGDDEYRPLIQRLVEMKVHALVPQIDVVFPDTRGGKDRWLITSPHLCDATTDSPSYEDLLGATDAEQYASCGLVSPFLWDYDATRSGEQTVRSRIPHRPMRTSK